MASILPPTTKQGALCARCGVDLHVGDPPIATSAVWITCPDCGIRLWHEEKTASMLIGIHDIDEARAHWQTGASVH
jgi:DNA-directed RNA polymerase subunit RPC12/RpoP